MSWKILFQILAPIGAFIGAVWVAGYRVGSTEAKLKDSILTQQETINSHSISIGTLKDKIAELADCITLEEVEHNGYLTKADLKMEQQLCQKDRIHEIERIVSHIKTLCDTTHNLAKEMREIKEALLKSGALK